MSSTIEQIKRLITNHRKAADIISMSSILVTAIILRIQPLRWGDYLNESDPFYWNRVAEYIARNGFTAWSTWIDTLSWYPMGNYDAHFNLIGNSFSAAIIYWILNGVGLNVSVHAVSLYFPILMACCTCVAVYYLAKDLGGRYTGLLAALFVAITPSYLSRTNLGFFDTENIAIFGIVATALFFLRSMEQDKTPKKRVTYAALGGLTLGYALISWMASRYIIGLLLLFGVASLLLGRSSWRLITSLVITTGVGFLMAVQVPVLGLQYLLNIDNLAVFGILALLIAHEFLRTRIDEKRSRLLLLGVVVLGLVTILVLPSFGVGLPIKGKFAQVINPFRSSGLLFSSISEHKVTTWPSFFANFGSTIFLSIFGAYLLIKRRDDRSILATIFFLTSLYFASTLLRLVVILSIPVSILAAYGLTQLATAFSASEPSLLADPKIISPRKRMRIVYPVSKPIKLALILILGLSFVPYIQDVAAFSQRPTLLAMSGVPAMIDGKYASDWPDALNWMRVNTTPGSIICSWWDYGYWIQGVANRTTLADGSTRNATQIRYIAQIMLKQQNESLTILKSYNVDYVVVFHTYNPKNPVEEWPYGDNVLWPQMANIAGYDLETFYDVDQDTGQISYTPAFTNSTIYKLMYQKTNMPHFQLAYESENGWVLVYRIEY